MRILIADTDETTLEILQSFLFHHGLETEIASNAIEGLALLREFRPHVLILGTGLLWGGSDGLLTVLQEESQFKHVLLILSAFSSIEFDSSTIQRPVNFLKKPFRLVDLLWQLDVMEAIVEASFDPEDEVLSEKKLLNTFYPKKYCGLPKRAMTEQDPILQK